MNAGEVFTCAQVAMLSFDPAEPETWAEIALPAELERAVPKRRAEFRAGRRCVTELYRRAGLNLPLPGWRETGGPLWPSGWIGSISHSRNRAAACLASRQRVHAIGLDLEYVMPEATALRVRDSILHAAETAASAERLTLIFSFKESLYKALHPLLQRFIGFDEVRVETVESGRIGFEPVGELARQWPAGAPLQGTWRQQDELLITGYEWGVV